MSRMGAAVRCEFMRGVVTRLDELELWDGELFMLSRRRRGVAQLELSRLTGISQVAISRYEAGARMPEELVDRLWAALEAFPVKGRLNRMAAVVAA